MRSLLRKFKIIIFTTVLFTFVYLLNATAHNKTVILPLNGHPQPLGNAVEGDVVQGKTFSSSTGTGLTGTRPVVPVDVTGQVVQQTPGDDGQLQMGVDWPIPRFTDNADGTVTDNLTGLIWLKNANCAGTARDWPTAISDVAQLNTDGTMNFQDCGDTSNGGSYQTDWRLPNIEELHSLSHYGVFSPALPNAAGTAKWSEGDPFASVVSSGATAYYWSSTSYAGNTASMKWTVYMERGYVTPNAYNNNTSMHVWPVRGGN